MVTRLDEALISDLTIYDPLISDHEVIIFSYAADKPRPVKKTINYRSLKKIDFVKFCDDVNVSLICTAPPEGVAELASTYNSELTRILNDHAPLKSKLIHDQVNCNWYTNELGDLKHPHRKLEHKHKA